MPRHFGLKDSIEWESMTDGQFDMHDVCDDADSSGAPRVLMVGYDERITSELSSALGEGCAISQASSAREVVEELGQDGTDVLLINYHAGSRAMLEFAESVGHIGVPVLSMHADPVEVRALGDIVKALAKRSRRS